MRPKQPRFANRRGKRTSKARGGPLRRARFGSCLLAAVVSAAGLYAQTDDSNARPPVSKTDIDIVRRAAQILNSPDKWNRADKR